MEMEMEIGKKSLWVLQMDIIEKRNEGKETRVGVVVVIVLVGLVGYDSLSVMKDDHWIWKSWKLFECFGKLEEVT
ncbi:uncharacterized protein MELLADRAFT_72277 [Melampsora larici-populina 98AG31]|uniref:Uncharacterized protein n=1 Tax=Melampsora larici-populina (strain 98AG31 / pathotype 3-4-7) TaxID=747676 RepID=F4RRV4_MELLP|nr:uncharacterized protein MELLADRAFT_72277 [Melampsora larici-populina 98AG31]EGG04887.1 hypothetical protein MELLADRAFT_72277 [Melampsora larici-populina 98AG31]